MRSAEEIILARNEIIQKYGEWTAHKTHLGYGVYTFDKEWPIGFPAVVKLLDDFLDKPIAQLRVLDLASFEGGISIELAQQGAEVLGIEGRATNIAKAKFSKEVLELSNLEFVQDDVRNLSAQKYGTFDIVICSGILYHLNHPDCFHLIEAISSVCKKLLYLNTHFVGQEPLDPVYNLGPLESVEYKGNKYSGRSIFEHFAQDSSELRLSRTHSSLDNEFSLWLTYDSLKEALERSGFLSIYHCLTYWYTPHRGAFVALKKRE